MPDEPDILRLVDIKERIIYDNIAANPNANIIRLV